MALPAQLRSLQHHLRTAQEHDTRDPVVAYYCEFKAKAVANASFWPSHCGNLASFNCQLRFTAYKL